MSNINWDNVVSAVATNEGLVVTERQGDGTLGAPQVYAVIPQAGPHYRGPGSATTQFTSPPSFTGPLSFAEVQVIKVALESFMVWSGQAGLAVGHAIPAWATAAGWTMVDEARARTFVSWFNGRPGAHLALAQCVGSGICTVLEKTSVVPTIKWWTQNWSSLQP
jgi:hypothetical protein